MDVSMMFFAERGVELKRLVTEHLEVRHTEGRYCEHCKWGKPRDKHGDITEIRRLSPLWDFHDRDCPVAKMMELCDLWNSPFPTEEVRRVEEAEYQRKAEEERRRVEQSDGVWFGSVKLPHAEAMHPTTTRSGTQQFSVVFHLSSSVWNNITHGFLPMHVDGVIVGAAQVNRVDIDDEVVVVFSLTSPTVTVNAGHLDKLLGEPTQ